MTDKNEYTRRHRLLRVTALFLIRVWARVCYRPQVHCVDPAVQTARLNPPRIIIANHQSTKDALLMLAVLRGDVSVLVAKDWYEKPQYHWLLAGMGYIPCDRYGLDTAWLHTAVSQLREGRSVLIFPEGRTRHDGEMNSFKSGFAMLAAMSGVSVVPARIDGDYRFGQHQHIELGTPVSLERSRCLDAAYLTQQSEDFRTRVKDMNTYTMTAAAV